MVINKGFNASKCIFTVWFLLWHHKDGLRSLVFSVLHIKIIENKSYYDKTLRTIWLLNPVCMLVTSQHYRSEHLNHVYDWKRGLARTTGAILLFLLTLPLACCFLLQLLSILPGVSNSINLKVISLSPHPSRSTSQPLISSPLLSPTLLFLP